MININFYGQKYRLCLYSGFRKAITVIFWGSEEDQKKIQAYQKEPTNDQSVWIKENLP